MAGGGQGSTTSTTTQKSEPWSAQKPYLEKGFSEAERIYDSEKPEYFPWDTTVGWSPETTMAMDAQSNRAMTGSPVNMEANNQYAKTLRGDYLNPQSNPYLANTIATAVQPIASQFTNTTMPALKSTWAKAGRYGSPGHGFAERNASESFLNAVGKTAGDIAFGNYNTERGRQTGLIPGAPDFAARDYDDFGKLAEVGSAYEGQAQQELQSNIDRFDFEQNKDAAKLAQYMSVVGDKNWGGTTTGTATRPYFKPDPFATALGGATAAGGLAGKFVKPTVICAECRAQGLMPEDMFEADEAYARALREVDPELVAGYQRWAPWVVRQMRKSRAVAKTVAFLSMPVWKALRGRMTGGRGSMVGEAMLAVGEPLCRFLGRNRQPDLDWSHI